LPDLSFKEENSMKMTPAYKKAQGNMAPGVITAGGFLGDDERDIKDIITEDEELMEYFSLDYEKVCTTLEYLLDQGERGLGEFTTVDETWLVRTLEARGHLPCPFEDGIHRKITCEAVNIKNNRKILFSTISIHLLREHHFHEGKGSEFRLDPEALKKVLNI